MEAAFKKQLWLSIGIILGSGIIAGVALYFLSGNLSDEADKIISKRTEIQTQTAALLNLASLKRDAPQAVRYEAAMRKLLPGQYALVGFGQWLSSLGVKHGVTTSYALQGSVTPAQPGSPGIAGFSMDAEGPHDSVIAFLKDLESDAPGFLLSLDAFDVSKSGVGIRISSRGSLFFQL